MSRNDRGNRVPASAVHTALPHVLFLPQAHSDSGPLEMGGGGGHGPPPMAPAPAAHGLAGETTGKRVLARGSSPGEAMGRAGG